MSIELQQRARVLIVLMGSVGDVVRGLTVPTLIERARPDVTVGWLVEPRCRPLLERHPHIDVVIEFDRSAPFSGLINLRAALKAFRADVAMDLQRHSKSGFFTWLSGAPMRIGFNQAESKEGNWLFSNRQIPALGPATPKLMNYLAFVEAIGISTAAGPEWETNHYVPGTAAAGWNPGTGKSVALVLGSSWESKDWPAEHYQRLAGLLAGQNYRLLLVGGSESSELGLHIERAAAGLACNLAGKTSVTDLFPLLRSVNLAIGPDSGPAHIAGSVGTPYVALFGPTDPLKTGPFGPSNRILQLQLDCSPCYQRRCPGLGTLCMRGIRPEEVFRLAASLLNR